jgi:membrane protease YdiL (CAAX protease family)
MALPDNLRTSAAFRLTVLFTAFFLFLLIAAGIGAAVSAIPGIPVRWALLTASAVQCVVAFCMPVWITGRLTTDSMPRFTGLTERVSWRPFAGVLIVYLLSLPAMNQLIAWNEAIHFPAWGAGIEATLRGWEEANGAVAEKMLSSLSVGSMIAGVAIIGLLTGFSEELFFRGGLQRILGDGMARKHVAVWVSAFIFSAIHFQFFGFFPRLIMGAFFGYLLVWTGSLWPAIFAHALNNSAVVVSVWKLGDAIGEFEQFGVTPAGEVPMKAIISVAFVALFFCDRRCRRFFFNNITRSGHGS